MDLSVREALDFEAKLHGYSTALREEGWGVVGGVALHGLHRGWWGWGRGAFRGKRSSGIKALPILCIDVQVGSIRKRSTLAYNLQFKIIE